MIAFDIPHTLEVFALIASVTGGARYVWPMARKQHDVAKARRAAFDQALLDISEIKHQTRANGGTSMFDLISDTRRIVRMETAARRMTEERAIWEGRVDASGAVVPTFVSRAWVRLTGQGLGDVAGGGWAQCVAPEDRARVLAAADDAERAARLFEADYLCVNVLTGERTPVRHIGKPVYERDTLVGWIGMMTPVTAVPPVH